MLKRSSLFFLVFLAAGCASSSTSPASADRVIAVDERTGTTIRAQHDRLASTMIAAPVDTVWKAVESSYAMLKVSLTHVNRPAGEQGNRKFLMSRTFFNRPVSTYLNCGDDPFGGPNANAYPVTVSLVTRVRPEGTGTVLETALAGFTSKPGAGANEIYCATTGALEMRLAEMVASRIR